MRKLISFLLLCNLAASAELILTWNDNSTNETGFFIERGAGASPATFVEIARVGTNVTTYSDKGLPPNTVYSYRVGAFNSAGKSGFAGPVSATTQDPPTAPTLLKAEVVPTSAP